MRVLSMQQLFIGICLLTSPLYAGVGSIFFTDNDTFPTHDAILYRTDLNGLTPTALASRPGATAGFVVLDRPRGRLLWTSLAPNDVGIRVCNLDGGSPGILIATADPWGVAIHYPGSKIYWSERNSGKIRRANLDGSGIEDVLTGIAELSDIEIDPVDDKIYWSSSGIERAKLDGSSREVIHFGDGPILDEPMGLALDIVARKIYWVDRGNGNRIGRSNLDGSGFEHVYTTSDGFDIELDPVAGHLYFSRQELRQIRVITTSGTFVGNVNMNNAPLWAPRGLALSLTDPDCDLDGIPNVTAIAAELAPDCNGNGVPDTCEGHDCDGSGRLDECDIDLGAPDCNGNGYPDSCDVASMTSPDCNTNLVPDECDLASQTSPDCNYNSIPDECDVASMTSLDCNTNGVPDECDPDCNRNQVPDDCDLVATTSFDCNGNTYPDECDLGVQRSYDCNVNAIPDECEGFVPCPGSILLFDVNSGGGRATSANYSILGSLSPSGVGFAGGTLQANQAARGAVYSLESGFLAVESFACRRYGDIAPLPNGDGIVELGDILCVLAGYGGTGCPRADIAPCGGDGLAELADVLAILGSYSGTPPCPDACQQE